MAKACPSAVLYVEDQENDAFLMRRAFTREGDGLTFQTVEDGQSAIEYLSGEGGYQDRTAYPLPAVVLLDLKMPRMDGFQVLDWIRHQPEYKSLPVVIFSSSPLDEDKDRARQLGATDYWEKNTSPTLFTDVVKRVKQAWM